MKRTTAAILALIITIIGMLTSGACAEYNMPFYIEVDITNQIVTVYKTEDDSIVRQMICSSGMNDCTPLGEYFMCAAKSGRERTPWMPLSIYNCFVKYGARIYRGYLFHSIPFAHRNNSTMDMEAYNQLGTPTSHGCIRLRVEDAKFIATYCKRGTYVKIYKSETPNEELRAMLKEASYCVENGVDYLEFLGYSSGNELGRGSSGERVADIQARMRALGFYDGEITGRYDLNTVNGVKRLQKLRGFAQNGIATEAFQETLFADDAPVSQGTITLREGWSGPVVECLQKTLMELGVYEGEPDGVYDVDVADAVRVFQSACGYSQDGVATPEVQQAAYAQLRQIHETFGEDAQFTVERTDEPMNVAVVPEGVSVPVRAKPDTGSAGLTRLYTGDRAVIVKSSGNWSAVIAKGVKGYVSHKRLFGEVQQNTILKYSANEKEYAIGHTLEEYLNGAQSVAQTFSAETVAAELAALDAAAETYAQVETGEADVSLNLRREPEADGEVLAQVPNGTRVYIVENGDVWTKVTYEDYTGYVMSDYLVDAEAETDAEEEEEKVYALVIGTKGGKAAVYAAGADDARVLGSLPADTRVEVLTVDENGGWAKIALEGHEGWMRDAHLKFEM